MEPKKQSSANKMQNYKRKQVHEVPEKNDFISKLKTMGKKLGQLEKRDFWYAHLPFPKFLRKPRIQFAPPRINPTVPIPNRIIMFVVSLFLVGFSIAGGAYDIVSKTTGRIAVGYDTSTHPATPIFFYNSLNDQFMLEGIIAFALILCGFIGFLFIHQSTKHFYRPKYSYMLFAIGIILIFFSVFSLQSIVVNQKDVHLYSDLY